eukprot:gene42470-52671_t
MGTTEYFSVVAYSQVTNSGFTSLNGNLALYPLTLVSGFPVGVVNGNQYVADPTGLAAQMKPINANSSIACWWQVGSRADIGTTASFK